MQIAVSFIAGLIFGLGLILSGMTDPSKVIGFLDLTGSWNPSLALVMIGAILVGLIAFRFAELRSAPVFGKAMHLPATRPIDRRLILGGLTFGVGWGLAGFCPGPALTSLVGAGSKPLIFVVAMLAGMAIYEIQNRLVTSYRRSTA
jgi:uncharacterized membrane protein YedE/YeeE